VTRTSLGEFEKLVMLAVLRLGAGAYGATIIQGLEERTGRTTSPGAVYVSLRRLEKKGMVSSRLGDPSPTRGGRPKRYYAVEREGILRLRQAQEDWSTMVCGLEGTLEQTP
jgi:DNA-binding PadR family transcriptional regulator